MDADTLEHYDRCPRLTAWNAQYLNFQLSPIRALYSALTTALTTSTPPEQTFMDLAINPGVQLEDENAYALAKHYSALVTTLSTYLCADSEPLWTLTAPTSNWTSATFDCGSSLRRLILIDHFTESRKLAEIRSWRTVAETSIYNKPILLNFLSIGTTKEGRRISPWTRTLAHPRSKQIRFAKKYNKADGFSENWLPVWREHWEGSTLDWLKIMQDDNVFDTLVHSVRVPVSPRREEILEDIARLGAEIQSLPPNPPMRRSSCYTFSPCRYINICHGSKPLTPADAGYISLDSLVKSA